MANRPKLEFLINVPTVVRLGDNFKNGEGQYGPWFGWGATDGAGEKTLFADQQLHDLIKGYSKNTALVITKQQIGPKQFAWHVRPDGVEPPPAYQPPPIASMGGAVQSGYVPVTLPNGRPEPSYVPDTGNRESYRSERVERAKEAVADAMETLQVDALDENVRALAISFLIDEQHKRIAPPEDGNPF